MATDLFKSTGFSGNYSIPTPGGYSNSQAPAPYRAPAPATSFGSTKPMGGISVGGMKTYTGPPGGLSTGNPTSTRPVALQQDRDYQYNQQASRGAASDAKRVQDATGADWTVDQYGNTSFKSGQMPVNVSALEATLNRVEGTGGSGPGAMPPPPSFLQAQMPTRGPGSDGSMADSAAFSRAKDRTGLTARASMNALRDSMSERGISGSGIEGKLTGDILGRAEGQLGDFDREAVIRDFDRSNDMTDENYRAAVDMSKYNATGANAFNDANANRAVTMRGQDVNAGNNRVQSLATLASLRGMGVVY